MKEIGQLGLHLDTEFEKATSTLDESVPVDASKRNLFQVITSVTSRKSPKSSPKNEGTGGVTKRKSSNFRKASFYKNGRMQSSQHLLMLYNDPDKKKADDSKVSEIYIPKEKRTFKSQQTKVSIDLKLVSRENEKKVKFDL